MVIDVPNSNQNKLRNPTRIENEKSFHDEAFADNRRASVSKYYSLLGSIREDFQTILYDRKLKKCRALEYGCGKGSHAYMLAAKGANVLGIDISQTAVELSQNEAAKRGLVSLQFKEMNAEELKLNDKSMDFVCGSGILHHLNLEAAANEISRVLADGGEAVFIEPLAHNPALWLYRKFTPNIRTQDEHPLTKVDFQLFERKFKSVDAHFYYLTSLLALPFVSVPGVRTLVRVLNRFDQWLFKYLPFTRYMAWQVIIRLKK